MPQDRLMALALEVDDVHALVAQVNQREEGLDLAPILLEPAHEQGIAPLLRPREDGKRFDEAAEHSRDAHELPLTDAGGELLPNRDPGRRALVVKAREFARDNVRLGPVAMRRTGPRVSRGRVVDRFWE